MKLHRHFLALAALLPALLSSSCVLHGHSTEFNGLVGMRGEPIEYQSTTSWAVHLVFAFPLIGNAKQSYVIDRWSAEASERGGKRARISQTSTSYFGALLTFPLSLIFTPVVTTVEGDIEGAVAPE